MMKMDFPDGGYVLHKFQGCSAWFDPHGVLIDAERTTMRAGKRVMVQVRVDGPQWRELEERGSVYAKPQEQAR